MLEGGCAYVQSNMYSVSDMRGEITLRKIILTSPLQKIIPLHHTLQAYALVQLVRYIVDAA